MRKLTLALLLILGLAACRQEKNEPSLIASLQGTWELRTTSGFPGNINYPPGNGILLKFLPGSIVESWDGGRMLSRNTFALKPRKDCIGTDVKMAVFNVFTEGNYNFLSLNGDQLTLFTPNCFADGGMSAYERLR
ncbi:hypothetical protein KJS94_01970 [Flavihumibacter rivuli]|uniref:hypothetical protein n=1 Tax=Flavihumibacter rivuli TaxID=2838156 RepID=UPI001BDEF588|nr:hypothetical protein [Flavihumibacter rivuli]ULQ56961.1 hypothetical protein KJS94_01970 [Flavihumibacter rivuli]